MIGLLRLDGSFSLVAPESAAAVSAGHADHAGREENIAQPEKCRAAPSLAANDDGWHGVMECRSL
jgi:hypothetical protein